MVVLTALAASARPHFGNVTDGKNSYEIMSNSGRSWYTLQGLKNNYYLRMVRATENVYVVEQVPRSEYMNPIPGIEAGDSAMKVNNDFFFFNASRRAYKLLRYERPGLSPEQLRRADSLSIVEGVYQWAGGNSLRFSVESDCQPSVEVGLGAAENISFRPDLVEGQTVYMHIRTPKRNWLLRPTAEGLSIYQAVWNPQSKKYSRGALVRNAKRLDTTHPGSFSFDYEGFGMPFLDILDKYCSDEMLQRLVKETTVADKKSVLQVYNRIIRKMLALRGRRT